MRGNRSRRALAAGAARVCVLLLPLLWVHCAQATESQRLALDPNHLSVSFFVEHIGYAKVLGMFREAEGTFEFDPETHVVENVRIVIQTTSVFTNQEDRDKHLRSADFLNVEAFPEMVFEAPHLQLIDGKGTLEGSLTLVGVTKPLTLSVTWNRTAESPLAEGPLKTKPVITGMSARGALKRSDYGMTYGVADDLVGDMVDIRIEFEARHP